MVVVDPTKVRRQRLRRALTTQSLADLAGISRMTVWRMERTDDARPGITPATLDLIAEALCCEPVDLLPDEPAHEIECPSCGASIRARMADA